MIEFHNVTKRYEGGYEALSNVSMSLGDGEMAFLTGHSGAGKSTVLQLVLDSILCNHHFVVIIIIVLAHIGLQAVELASLEHLHGTVRNDQEDQDALQEGQASRNCEHDSPI